MKILIGYDGSRSADAALDDLHRAGLPDAVEAKIISVAEVWMPMPPNGDKPENHLPVANSEWMKTHESASKKAIVEAETLSRHAAQRLNIKFPVWNVTNEAAYGSPAREILARAEVFKPDLIVVGSQGKTTVNRILLGSISSKVLAEAGVSVRVARGRVEVDEPAPTRIIIGFDGSPGSMAAVEAVASRKWREQTEVRLVSAADSMIPAAIGRFVPPIGKLFEDEKKNKRIRIEKLAETALRKLNDAKIKAELSVEIGNPKQILIEVAEKWSADCIFVGSYSFGNKLKRFLIGSISAAVAERAHCSVEVIRHF